jgi:hypothetical protein
MNGESPLVDTSVLIDYFEGIDCRESAVLDKLLERFGQVSQGTSPVSPYSHFHTSTTRENVFEKWIFLRT